MILGVHREYGQAGKPESDWCIANLVGDEMRTLGYEVEMVAGEAVASVNRTPLLIFSMARGREALNRLSCMEASGVPVVNSTDAIRKCYRRAEVYGRMRDTGLPVPETSLRPLSDAMTGAKYPLVLKKPDAHGKKGDTFVVRTDQEMEEALDSLKASGTEYILVQAFVQGDSHKFYGADNEVFLPDYHGDGQGRIRSYAAALAGLIGMNVYGGDFICGADGEAYLIV